MTKRFKTAFASLSVAMLCTLGASSQASAFDLLEELLGGAKYADSCGCSQKSGGHVQRCGSDCGKSVGGHAQRSGGKGLGHVQRSGGKGGVAQRGGSKGSSCGGAAQRGGCHGGKGGVAQHGGKGGSCGAAQRGSAQKGGSVKSCGGAAQCGGSKGGSCGGAAQRGGCSQKGGSKGGYLGGHAQRGSYKAGTKGGGKGSKSRGDLFSMMRSKMDGLKCKLTSSGCDCSCGDSKGHAYGKGYELDGKAGGFGNGKGIVVPAPTFEEGIQAIPVPSDPDPTT